MNFSKRTCDAAHSLIVKLQEQFGFKDTIATNSDRHSLNKGDYTHQARPTRRAVLILAHRDIPQIHHRPRHLFAHGPQLGQFATLVRRKRKVHHRRRIAPYLLTIGPV